VSLFHSNADSKITVVATIRAKSGHEADVRKAFAALVEPARLEAGCLSYQLLEDKYYTGSFFTFEEWTSEQLLEEHLARIKEGLNKSKAWLQEDVRICVVKPVI